MQIRSSGSITIISLDIDDIMRRLKESACALRKADNNVSGVFLFGSLAAGEAVPGSDADIMIVLKKSDKKIIDRVTDFMNFFKNVGLGVDIFSYTEKEINEFRKEQRPFIMEMFAHRVKLA